MPNVYVSGGRCFRDEILPFVVRLGLRPLFDGYDHLFVPHTSDRAQKTSISAFCLPPLFSFRKGVVSFPYSESFLTWSCLHVEVCVCVRQFFLAEAHVVLSGCVIVFDAGG